MKTHTTDYSSTFIAIAADCPAVTGTVPPAKGTTQTVAQMQFDILHQHPYAFTSDDVLFQVYADRQDLTKSEYKAAREQFFSKGQPCFRASPLTKRYGWGVHCDPEGKIAIYGCETEAYKRFFNDKSLQQVKSMRNAKG